MRDVHERDADVLLDPLELELELLAQPQVERAERLVEQQRARPVHERAGERHALLLAAGELRRLAPAVLAELDHLQRLADARLDTRTCSTFLRSRPNATFFSTVRCGNSA